MTWERKTTQRPLQRVSSEGYRSADLQRSSTRFSPSTNSSKSVFDQHKKGSDLISSEQSVWRYPQPVLTPKPGFWIGLQGRRG